MAWLWCCACLALTAAACSWTYAIILGHLGVMACIPVLAMGLAAAGNQALEAARMQRMAQRETHYESRPFRV